MINYQSIFLLIEIICNSVIEKHCNIEDITSNLLSLFFALKIHLDYVIIHLKVHFLDAGILT